MPLESPCLRGLWLCEASGLNDDLEPRRVARFCLPCPTAARLFLRLLLFGFTPLPISAHGKPIELKTVFGQPGSHGLLLRRQPLPHAGRLGLHDC